MLSIIDSSLFDTDVAFACIYIYAQLMSHFIRECIIHTMSYNYIYTYILYTHVQPS